jgi:hypothetical protein
MSSEDIPYYRQRAAAERVRAAEAASPEVAQAHLTLVTMYENLIERMERGEWAQDVDPVPPAAMPIRDDGK